MSYQDSWAALHLEMTDKVPRTEFSAEFHWDLVKAVTGIEITPESTEQDHWTAMNAFRKAWDYGFLWGILIHNQVLENCRTKMGHAVYAKGGTDFNTEITCPFEDPEEVLAFQPMEVYGKHAHSKLVADFNAHYHKMQENCPHAVATTGTYVTLISGLLEIFGWDMLLWSMGTDPKGFGTVANRYAAWMQQYFEALADCDAPVVMVHDDIVWTSGAFAQPQWYREFVFPNYKKYLAPLKEAGKKILFTSDGTYTEFIDDLVECGMDGFVLEPTVDMQYIADKYGKTHVFMGNADTRILLKGSREDIYNEVKRCMDIGKKYPGFFMSVGNHIPPNTPVESALYYNEVFEKLRKR